MSGETMRDRFAMAAMVADLTREGAPTNPVDAKYAALRAYGLADAMLAARGVSAPQPAVEPVPQWQYKLRQAEMARDAADAQLLRVQTAMADIQDALDRARRHA